MFAIDLNSSINFWIVINDLISDPLTTSFLVLKTFLR